MIVIDSDQLINNPKKMLEKWCYFLNIDFDNSMLKWEKKNYSTDGIWANHWYDSVLKTDRFNKEMIDKDYKINKQYEKIFEKSLEIYNQMLLLSI